MKLKIEKDEYKNMTLRLNKKIVLEMDKICKEKDISMNKFIQISIGYALKNLEKE